MGEPLKLGISSRARIAGNILSGLMALPGRRMVAHADAQLAMELADYIADEYERREEERVKAEKEKQGEQLGQTLDRLRQEGKLPLKP